ncbi:unnamed protein product [Discosporangium mesarthrocarpum]
MGEREPVGKGENAAGLGWETVTVLCTDVSVALGLYMRWKAADEFENVQLELLDGCVCHPIPLCREVWAGALSEFLCHCDSDAKLAVFHTFGGMALEPHLPMATRRNLLQALAPCLPTLSPPVVHLLQEQCFLRLQPPLSPPTTPHGIMATSSTSPAGSDPALTQTQQAALAPALELLEALMKAGLPLENDVNTVAVAAASSALGLTRTSPGPSAGPSPIPPASAAGGEAARVEAIPVAVVAAAARFLTTWVRGKEDVSNRARAIGLVPKRRNVQEGFGGAMNSQRGGLGLLFGLGVGILPGSGALGAVLRLAAEVDFGELHDLCSLATEEAANDQLSGEGLLALAEGIMLSASSAAGMEKYEEGANEANRALLTKAFSSLFGASLWPVSASALTAVESLARHSGAKTAVLLPGLLHGPWLAAFRGRLSKRLVKTTGNPREVEAPLLRQLIAAGDVVLEESVQQYNHLKTGSGVENCSQEVILREGDNLAALVSQGYTGTIIRMRPLESDRGIYLTIQKSH